MEGAEDVGHQGSFLTSPCGEEAGEAAVSGFSLGGPPGGGMAGQGSLGFTVAEGGLGSAPEGRGKWDHSCAPNPTPWICGFGSPAPGAA